MWLSQHHPERPRRTCPVGCWRGSGHWRTVCNSSVGVSLSRRRIHKSAHRKCSRVHIICIIMYRCHETFRPTSESTPPRLPGQLSLTSCGKSQGTMYLFFPRSRSPLSAQSKSKLGPDSPIAQPPTLQPPFLPFLSFPPTPALINDASIADSDEVSRKGAVSNGVAIKGSEATDKLLRVGDTFACRARGWGGYLDTQVMYGFMNP